MHGYFFQVICVDSFYLFEQDTVLELEFQGVTKKFTMLQVFNFPHSICVEIYVLLSQLTNSISYFNLGMYSNYLQTWPVRTPRPVASKLAADTPLLTGQVMNAFYSLSLPLCFLFLIFATFILLE